MKHKKHRNEGKPVLVTWRDAGHHYQELLIDEDLDFNPKVTVSTVGFYIGIRENHLLLAEEYNKERRWARNVTTIPRAMILEVRFLK